MIWGYHHFWKPPYDVFGSTPWSFEASSIPSVLSHLRSQPINDIDGMLLSKVGLTSAENAWDYGTPQENLKKFGKHKKRASFFLQKNDNVFECQSSLEVDEGVQLLPGLPPDFGPQKISSQRCQGDLRAYELWPHIFPLDGDHMKSTMLEEPRIETGETFQRCFSWCHVTKCMWETGSAENSVWLLKIVEFARFVCFDHSFCVVRNLKCRFQRDPCEQNSRLPTIPARCRC